MQLSDEPDNKTSDIKSKSSVPQTPEIPKSLAASESKLKKGQPDASESVKKTVGKLAEISETKEDISVVEKKSIDRSKLKSKPKEEEKPKEVKSKESPEEVTVSTKKPFSSESVTSDDARIKIKENPKLKSVSEETSAKIKTASKVSPFKTDEDSARKDIKIKAPEIPKPIFDEMIQIKITEPDDEPFSSERKSSIKQELIDDFQRKSVSFDKEVATEPIFKKKVRRTRYDPLAFIPDDDEAMQEIQSEPKHVPEIPKPRPRYDPFKYVPDKEDVANVDDSNEPEVNTTQKHKYTYTNTFTLNTHQN